MVALVSPIPYVPLSMWLWCASLPWNQKMGSVCPPFEPRWTFMTAWTLRVAEVTLFLWLRPGGKNARPACFVLLGNSLRWKPAASTALDRPCCEEAQAHWHEEILWRSPETKLRGGLCHPPAAQPSVLPSPAAVCLGDSEPEPPGCPLSKFLTHRNGGREESDGYYFNPWGFDMICYLIFQTGLHLFYYPCSLVNYS